MTFIKTEAHCSCLRMSYISITASLSLLCVPSRVSSQHKLLSDVYIFWIAIIATIKELLKNGSAITGVSNELALKIICIINTHYYAFSDKSPCDIYFAGFFLHPSMSFKFFNSHLIYSYLSFPTQSINNQIS